MITMQGIEDKKEGETGDPPTPEAGEAYAEILSFSADKYIASEGETITITFELQNTGDYGTVFFQLFRNNRRIALDGFFEPDITYYEPGQIIEWQETIIMEDFYGDWDIDMLLHAGYVRNDGSGAFVSWIESLPTITLPIVCNTDADTNCDSIVDRTELGVSAATWLSSSLPADRTKLGLAARVWIDLGGPI